MIEMVIILAYTIVMGISLIRDFWNDIVRFVKKCYRLATRVVNGIKCATKIFLKKIREGYEEAVELWRFSNGKYELTTTTRIVPAHEVPKEIREKVERKLRGRLDVTDDVRTALELY